MRASSSPTKSWSAFTGGDRVQRADDRAEGLSAEHVRGRGRGEVLHLRGVHRGALQDALDREDPRAAGRVAQRLRHGDRISVADECDRGRPVQELSERSDSRLFGRALRRCVLDDGEARPVGENLGSHRVDLAHGEAAVVGHDERVGGARPARPDRRRPAPCPFSALQPPTRFRPHGGRRRRALLGSPRLDFCLSGCNGLRRASSTEL